MSQKDSHPSISNAQFHNILKRIILLEYMGKELVLCDQKVNDYRKTQAKTTRKINIAVEQLQCKFLANNKSLVLTLCVVSLDQ